MSQTEVQLIKDAVIVNADVSNSAAIDVSKISGALPAAGGTITGDVTFDGETAGRDIVFDRSENSLEFADNAFIKFGTGDDLQIYHSGSHSIIKDAGTGNLRIQTNNLRVENAAGTENQLLATENDGVELYYDNSKILETESWGVMVTGTVEADQYNLQDSDGTTQQIRIGASGDLRLFHQSGENIIGANTVGQDIFFKSSSSSSLDTTSFVVRTDGSVTHLDNIKMKFGTSDDLQIYHNGTDSLITDSGTGSLALGGSAVFIQNAAHNANMASFVAGAEANLFHNGSNKLNTLSNGVQITGQSFISEGTINLEKSGAHHHRILANDTGNDLGFQQSSDTGANTNFTTYLRINDGGNISLPVDNQQLRLGASGDLILMHENDHSYVQAYNVGNMYLGCIHNGDVIVRQNSQNRYQFAAGGFNPLTDNVYDLGNSSYRWRNLYTGDINLSNKGSQNDVDGTWGDYTIQEGESDLFLINKRSGKKFKFMLQEVS